MVGMYSKSHIAPAWPFSADIHVLLSTLKRHGRQHKFLAANCFSSIEDIVEILFVLPFSSVDTMEFIGCVRDSNLFRRVSITYSCVAGRHVTCISETERWLLLQNHFSEPLLVCVQGKLSLELRY